MITGGLRRAPTRAGTPGRTRRTQLPPQVPPSRGSHSTAALPKAHGTASGVDTILTTPARSLGASPRMNRGSILDSERFSIDSIASKACEMAGSSMYATSAASASW